MLHLRGIARKQTECIKLHWSMRSLQNCLAAEKVPSCGIKQQSRPYDLVGPRSLSSAYQPAQHSLVRPYTTLLRCSCACPDQRNVYPLNPFVTVVRFRRRRMHRKQDTPQEASEEDEVNCHAFSRSDKTPHRPQMFNIQLTSTASAPQFACTR